MKLISPYNKIVTDENYMEAAQHGVEGFPFRFYYENVADFDFHLIDWHWHTEFEFVYIESGKVSFWIGDQKFDLEEGKGIFINSKMLHRLYSEADAFIPNFLFLPSFIAGEESIIFKKNVLPLIDSSLDYHIFSPDIPWQLDCLNIMKDIIRVQESENQEFKISILVQKLWLCILENVSLSGREAGISLSSQAKLQIMMQYIQENYAASISLDDIAASADVSKSTALKLFKSNLDDSPVNYLISYRLQRAAALLSNTDKKIASISQECGFNNLDYFCRLFKRVYKITPKTYRRLKQ